MSNAEIRSVMAQPLGVGSAITVFSNISILGGFTLYGLGAVAWLGVLSQWDVSKAYPLVGLGFVFTVAIGWLIGEQVTSLRAIGVALICTGVVLVGRVKMKPSIKWTSQSETFWLATIVFIALFMRVGAIAVLDHTPESDELAYMSMALNLSGKGIVDSMGNHAMYNVGYPLFILYPVFPILGENLFAAKSSMHYWVLSLYYSVMWLRKKLEPVNRPPPCRTGLGGLSSCKRIPRLAKEEFADSDNAFRIHVHIAFAETTERSICCLLRHPLWLTGFGWECRAFFGWRISSRADDRTSPFKA